MKVLISGAGIGGLAAARALIADGHEVTVYEQAAGLRQGGAAVTLWSNSTGVLGQLGVNLAGAGAPIDTLETRDRRGQKLISIDVAQAAARYGHPHVCLPRSRLLGLLADGLPAGTLVAGWTAPAVRQVLAAVTDGEAGFFPHCRHRVPKTWGSGRVTVIGDAAHSMPPTRAQGANQALEDAWALAGALREGKAAKDATGPDPVARALRDFERRRSAKAAIVSRQAGREDYNRLGPGLSRLTPAPLATRYYTRWLGQVSSFLDPGRRP